MTIPARRACNEVTKCQSTSHATYINVMFTVVALVNTGVPVSVATNVTRYTARVSKSSVAALTDTWPEVGSMTNGAIVPSARRKTEYDSVC